MKNQRKSSNQSEIINFFPAPKATDKSIVREKAKELEQERRRRRQNLEGEIGEFHFPIAARCLCVSVDVNRVSGSFNGSIDASERRKIGEKERKAGCVYMHKCGIRRT